MKSAREHTVKLDLTGAKWFKSSKSSANGQCVEVAFVDGQVAVRDSKNPTGPELVFTAAEWHAFVGGVAAGEFEVS
jgi:hypothetical protein